MSEQDDGFQSMGDFCKAVMTEDQTGQSDPRLKLLPDTTFEKDGILWRTNNKERRLEWSETIRYMCFQCGSQFVTAYLKPVTTCPFGCPGLNGKQCVDRILEDE